MFILWPWCYSSPFLRAARIIISGVCDIRGCGCASYTRGVGMPGPCSEGALQRSDVRELWKRGLTGHTSPPSHHLDSLCEFLPSPESYPGKCFLWRNTCSPYGRNHQEMAQGSAFHRECSSQHGNSFSKIVRYHTWLMEHMFLGMPPLCKVAAPSLSDIWWISNMEAFLMITCIWNSVHS